MIVQYILLRKDLESFSQGAIIAQACHSAVYSIEKYRSETDTAMYLEDITAMRKIILGISKEEVGEVIEELNSHGLDYTVWREQPEDIITCISLRPYKRDSLGEIHALFRRLRLY
jgi:peptidyl-tRNA hydrolase